MRRRRWRTAVLWGGCTVSVLIALLFVVSARWQIVIPVKTTFEVPTIYVGAGAVSLVNGAVYSASARIMAHDHNLSHWNSWSGRPHLVYVEFPLYAPFLAVAIPTLLVWRFVPKFPRGHCRRCGYNLTGLTEARCPECGTGFDTDESAV